VSVKIADLLVGRDARRIEDTWQYLYKGAYWRRGPVTMTAIAVAAGTRGNARARGAHYCRAEFN
jgi:mannonate dehydratase